MILEVELGLLGIAFVFVYIYSKIPEQEDVQNFWAGALKMMFLMLSLVTLVFLAFVLVGGSTEITQVNVYDNSGTLIGYEIKNATLDAGIKESLGAYANYQFLFFAFFLFLLALFLAYRIFLNHDTQKKKKKGMTEDIV